LKKRNTHLKMQVQVHEYKRREQAATLHNMNLQAASRNDEIGRLRDQLDRVTR
jgi:uncharacterized coiled-coil protein SlyX